MKDLATHVSNGSDSQKKGNSGVKERSLEKPHRVSLTPENDPRQGQTS